MSRHDAYAAAAAFDLRNAGGEWLLLVLHGLGGDRQQALGLIDGVDDPQFAVLSPDLRAHGETPVTGDATDFTFDALVADIVALVERLGQGSKPTIVAGISMGAALALRLALGGALDVRALALVRPAFADTPDPPNLAVMRVLADLLRAGDADAARTALLASPEYRAIAQVTALGAKSVEDQLTKPLARERVVRLEAVPRNIAWRDAAELATVGVPARVIGAGRDVMHPLDMARRTAALMPRASLVEVPPRDDDLARYDREIRAAIRQFLDEVFNASG